MPRCACLALIGIMATVTSAETFHVIAEETDGPLIEPWRILRPDPGYHGQWLVAGDLDRDGKAEIVTARNERQRVTAVVATTLNGKTLWRWGRANGGSHVLQYDVPVQIYDLDDDGRNEVWLSVEGYLLVLDGASGRETRRLPLPEGLEVADCITFADLRGTGRATDVIVKDRYNRLWAYSADWKQLWRWRPAQGKTCHHPTLIDIDGDGRDEVMAGYTMLDDNGHALWDMNVDPLQGHLDCCDVMTAGESPEAFRLLTTCCGAHKLQLLDGRGRTQWELTGHHFESVDAGRIRDDMPGKQVIVDVDHQPYGAGPLWLLDAKGHHFGTIVCGYARHHRLVDWDGDGLDEILIGNARRLFDGHGRCVARFGPADAFDGAVGRQPSEEDPGPFAVVADLDGDRRAEVILHYTNAVLIYKNDAAARQPSGTPLGTGPNFTLY